MDRFNFFKSDRKRKKFILQYRKIKNGYVNLVEPPPQNFTFYIYFVYIILQIYVLKKKVKANLIIDLLLSQYQQLIKNIMFNPQRKARRADIFMEERHFTIHLKKVQNIERSLSLRSQHYQVEASQEKYLTKLGKNKRQVKHRLLASIKKENNRLFDRLRKIDEKKNQSSQSQREKHFNHYFSNKKKKEKIMTQNQNMVTRINNLTSGVPSIKMLQKQYRRNRKYVQNCMKFPSIIKNKQDIKKKMSHPLLDYVNMSKS